MNLTELPKIIQALNDAGITKWLFVFFVLAVFAFILAIAVAIRVVPMVLRNTNARDAQESSVLTALSTNITTLTIAVSALTANVTAQASTNDTLAKNITALTNNQTGMQESAGRRDDQMDRMNDISLQTAKAADDQRNILLQQNTLLEGLSRTSESGNAYVRNLTESIIASSKDNAAAINAWGKTSTDNTNRVGAEIVDKINSIPSEVLKQATPAIDAIRSDITKILNGLPPGNEQLVKSIVESVSNEIRVIVGDMVTKVLKQCLDQTQELAQELDATEEALDKVKKATGPLSPLPSSTSPAPTTNTVSATADGGVA